MQGPAERPTSAFRAVDRKSEIGPIQPTVHRRGADVLADELLGRRTVLREIQTVEPVGRPGGGRSRNSTQIARGQKRILPRTTVWHGWLAQPWRKARELPRLDKPAVPHLLLRRAAR